MAPRGLISEREPSIVLKERKAVSGALVKEGTADEAGRRPACSEVEHLTMRFGGLVAVDDLSLRWPAAATSPR